MQTVSYRINDFGKVIGISRTSIYAMIKRGELQTIKIAGRTLIPASEVQRLLSGESQ